MVWACTEKRRRICEQESDGDGGAGERKERKTKAVVVDNINTDLSEGENCHWRKPNTGLNGGVS